VITFRTIAATEVLLAQLESTPQTELVSLTTYSETAETNASLTGNYTEVLSGLDLYTQAFDGGDTNIGGGISRGAESLTEKRFIR